MSCATWTTPRRPRSRSCATCGPAFWASSRRHEPHDAPVPRGPLVDELCASLRSCEGCSGTEQLRVAVLHWTVLHCTYNVPIGRVRVLWNCVWSLGINPTRIAISRCLQNPRLVAWLTEKSHGNEITPASGRREWVVLINLYEWKRWEVKCVGLHVMGHAPTVQSTTSRPRVT